MRTYSKDRNIRALVSELVDVGWEYCSGGKHGKLIAPNGRILTVPSTPSDRRAYLNFRGDVKRQRVGVSIQIINNSR